jgi:FADH2-dependent halogenase
MDAEVGIVGAGPAGSSLACYLARRGRDVEVYERDQFPRFHVGQSLIPMTVPLLRDLGIELSEADYALRKEGVIFHDPELGDTRRFDFDDTQEGTFTYAYQVMRAPFDKTMADRAEQLGAHVEYEASVEDWVEDRDGVDVRFENGNDRRVSFLVDASGQRAMHARKHDSYETIDSFGKIASFTLYEDVENRRFHELFSEGDVLIVDLPASWAWCISLPGNRASVGLVEQEPEHSRSPEDALEWAYSNCSFLWGLIEDATPTGQYRRSSNYSFYNASPSTDRTVALGDAYVFLDPIFASAIHRAIYDARELADELETCLEEGALLELDDYFQHIDRANQVFVRMIEKYYHTRWIENMFFADEQPPKTFREITSLLAGDVWREDNQFMNLLLEADSDAIPDQLGGKQLEHSR